MGCSRLGHRGARTNRRGILVSTFTTNKAVEQPAAGDYVGTWATPANSNYSVIDQALGTIQVIDLSAGSITLSTAQARSPFLNFIGALPSNVTVTIPGLSTSPGTIVSGGFYTIENRCTNSSARTVTLQTTVVGQQLICAPPGEAIDIKLEGTGSSQAGSIKFRNLGRVGSYWDYAGSSVPAWVSGCTVPPYLYCNGASFSSGTYPVLHTIFGGTTLPDFRGRIPGFLNDGTGRITSGSSTGGVDGNTVFASGGSQTTTLSSQNIPPVPITDPGHVHTIFFQRQNTDINAGAIQDITNISTAGTGTTSSPSAIQSATTGITAGSASPTNFSNLPPMAVGGIRMVRAA